MDHVIAVECRLLRNGGGVSLVGEALLFDGDDKMLGHLEPASDFANPQSDILLAFEAPLEPDVASLDCGSMTRATIKPNINESSRLFSEELI